MKKILLVLVAIITVVLTINVTVFASSIDTSTVTINHGKSGQFDDIGSTIVSTIRIIGMIISVGGLMILGIKYMLSSAEERATQKQGMIFYSIGAVLIFAIVNIVSAIYEWIK